MKRKSTILDYATELQVAERLADDGDPDAADFGLADLGIDIDHMSDADLGRLMRHAHNMLKGRRLAGSVPTIRQERMTQALSEQIRLRDTWHN